MKTTLTLYPRFEESIEVVIEYIPSLDNAECEGWWNIDNNVIALSWRLYSEFNRIEQQQEKRDFFQSLRKISAVQLR